MRGGTELYRVADLFLVSESLASCFGSLIALDLWRESRRVDAWGRGQ